MIKVYVVFVSRFLSILVVELFESVPVISEKLIVFQHKMSGAYDCDKLATYSCKDSKQTLCFIRDVFR